MKFNLLVYSVHHLCSVPVHCSEAGRYVFVASMQSPESNHGTATASYCCEDFGLKKTAKIKKADLNQRIRELRRMVEW